MTVLTAASGVGTLVAPTEFPSAFFSELFREDGSLRQELVSMYSLARILLRYPELAQDGCSYWTSDYLGLAPKTGHPASRKRSLVFARIDRFDPDLGLLPSMVRYVECGDHDLNHSGYGPIVNFLVAPPPQKLHVPTKIGKSSCSIPLNIDLTHPHHSSAVVWKRDQFKGVSGKGFTTMVHLDAERHLVIAKPAAVKLLQV